MNAVVDEELFTEGWRDPGDDCERLAAYLLFGAGTAGGLWMAGYALYDLGRATPEAGRWLDVAAIAIGLLMVGVGAGLFRSEFRHWNLRGLNAERVIAGLFLVGFALPLVGLEMEHPMATAAGFAAGAVVLGITLAIGLVCAFLPNLFVRRYRLERAYVVARFALDEKLQEVPDAPPPFEPSWTPCVRLRTTEGELKTLRATSLAYEFAEPGSLGDAEVRGSRIRRFAPRRVPLMH